MDEFSALIPANVPVTPVKKTGIFILRSSHPSIIRLVGVLGSVIVGVILWLIGRTWRPSGKRSRQADISQCNRRVRFTPKSRHVRCSSRCPLWAKSAHRQLIDHLVRAKQDGLGHIETECRGGLAVKDKLEF